MTARQKDRRRGAARQGARNPKRDPHQPIHGPHLDHCAGQRRGSGGACASRRRGRTAAPAPGGSSPDEWRSPRLRAFQSPSGEHGNRDGEHPSGSFRGNSDNRAASCHGSKPSRLNAERTVSAPDLFLAHGGKRNALYGELPSEYSGRKVSDRSAGPKAHMPAMVYLHRFYEHRQRVLGPALQ